MRCETCLHECTVVDFVTRRNLCEHLYLDSLAAKQNPSGNSTQVHLENERDFQSLLSSCAVEL